MSIKLDEAYLFANLRGIKVSNFKVNQSIKQLKNRQQNYIQCVKVRCSWPKFVIIFISWIVSKLVFLSSALLCTKLCSIHFFKKLVTTIGEHRSELDDWGSFWWRADPLGLSLARTFSLVHRYTFARCIFSIVLTNLHIPGFILPPLKIASELCLHWNDWKN